MKQIWRARFESGKEIVKTGEDFKNRLDFYNWICKNRLGKVYGKLIEIVAEVF